jgi:hypothetical protein
MGQKRYVMETEKETTRVRKPEIEKRQETVRAGLRETWQTETTSRDYIERKYE